MRRPGVLLAAVLALSGVAVQPATTHAECEPPALTKDMSDYIGFAFTATVVEVTDQTDPPMPGAAPFDWKVVLDVDRVYRGTVEDTLHWNGWADGCSTIRANMLPEGQRLFVSTEELDPLRLEAPGPFTIIWRKREGVASGDDVRWVFDHRSLRNPYNDFPSEARTAGDLGEIRTAADALNGHWREPVQRQALGAEVADVPLLGRILHRFGDHVEAVVEGLRRLSDGPA